MGMGGMAVNVEAKEAPALKLLVPSTSDIDKKKIMSRIMPNSVVCFSVVSMMQKRTKSKVLYDTLDELYMHKMGIEGLARAEVVEVEGSAKMNDMDGGRPF